MRLTEAIKQAVSIGMHYPDETICIYRTAPREFECEVGQNPHRKGVVQMIHTMWIHDGWYAKYHPEWVKHLPNNVLQRTSKPAAENRRYAAKVNVWKC